VNWYLFWRLVHFSGIVVFVAGHGVSAAVTVRVPRERDRDRLETLLSLSRATIVWSNVGLLVLLVGGVANWIRVDYPRQGWLWTAVAVLALLAMAGFVVAAPYFRRIRSAVASGDDARLDAVVSSAIPWTLFWLETAGTGVILWLMVYKPF
jgi:O-antigen/teichoic acid export membrane protein